jgi:hypothetical protein
MHRRWLVCGCVFLGTLFSTAWGQQVARVDKPAAPRAPAASGNDVLALAGRIDQYVNARLKEVGVPAAPQADDAEFCRRVHLDLVGRIPEISEVRKFLDDKAGDKRVKLVDKLLDDPAFKNHWINVWRSLLLPEVEANFEAQLFVPQFDAWLRKKVNDNTAWDQMVREVLTVPFTGQAVGPARRAGQTGEPTPDSYYLAKEAKPENLAASTSRTFLGIRIECAQCHNHPTAQWKQEQFWSLAAFFAGLQRQGQGNQQFAPVREVFDRRELAIPNDTAGRIVQAMFLDGTEPQWKHKVGPRTTLADWMVAPENPYFARAAANRVWHHFFGMGIVEPVDDMDPENPPSHPELLDDLAKSLTTHDFDLKFLMRAITASQTYQRTSAQTHKDQGDPRLFARMNVKGLTADMVFDSLAMAIGYRDPTPANQRRVNLLGAGTPRSDLTAKFNNSGEKRTETETSILQALSLMNGQVVADATSLDRSETLAGLVDSPFLTNAERIETLFLATLSRMPTAAEAERLGKYVEAGGPAKDSNKALADVFWALLNSGEFLLNH